MGRERPGSLLHLWRGRRVEIPQQARPGPHMQSTPGKKERCPSIVVAFLFILRSYFFSRAGGGGRLRVLRQAAAGYTLLGSQLLRGVRQRGRDDVRGRNAHVLLPGKGLICIIQHQFSLGMT